MAGVWRLPTTPNSGVWSTTRVVTKSSPFDSESLFLFYIPGLARLSSAPVTTSKKHAKKRETADPPVLVPVR